MMQQNYSALFFAVYAVAFCCHGLGSLDPTEGSIISNPNKTFHSDHRDDMMRHFYPDG